MSTNTLQFSEFATWRKAVIEAGGEVVPLKDTGKATRYEARNAREEVIGTYAFSEGHLTAEAPAVGPKVPKPKEVKPKVTGPNESSFTTQDDLKKSLVPKAARFAEGDKEDEEDDDDWDDVEVPEEDEDDDDSDDDDDYRDDDSDDEDTESASSDSGEQSQVASQPEDFPIHEEPAPMGNGEGMSIDESTLTDKDHEQGNVALEAFVANKNPEFATNNEDWEKAKEYANNPDNKFTNKWSVASAAYNKMQDRPEKPKVGPEADDDIQYDENNTQQFAEGVFRNPPHRKSLFHKLISKYGGRMFGKNKKGWIGRGQYITKFTIPDHAKQMFHAAARAAGFKLGDHYEVQSDHESQHLESQPVPTNTKVKASQHAEDEKNEVDNADEAPMTDVLPEVPPTLVNPDMPPVVMDLQKLQAVIAGLSTFNVVLPSTFTFQDPQALDVILAAINSAIKAKAQAEAEYAAQDQPESPPANEVPMAYTEQQLEAQYQEAAQEFPEDAQFAERRAVDDNHAYQIEIMHPTTIHGAYNNLDLKDYLKLNDQDKSIASLARQSDAIHKNLMKKIKKGVYDPEKATKLFGYYTKGISDHLHKHHDLPKATPATRELAARSIEKDFRAKAKDGEFDHYLSKSSQHAENFDGIQNHSRGKLHPYTIMTIEDEQGNRFNQGMHPSGWKGALHPWQGKDKSHATAEQAVYDEILKHKSSQHSELPPEVRQRIELLEKQNLQFQEERRNAVNKAAREGALMAITMAKVPPALKNKLASHYSTVQFNEGSEAPTFTAADVANLVAECLPPQLMIQFEEATEAKAPTASKKTGNDPQGNPLFNAASTEQFFEGGEVPSGHVPGDIAEKIISSGPLRGFGTTSNIPSMSQMVAAENQRVPNNVMRK